MWAVVRAGRLSQGARNSFLRGPGRPVRPSNTGQTVPLRATIVPWAAKATLRQDHLPGCSPTARDSSPPVPRAASAPRTRTAARIGSWAGRPNWSLEHRTRRDPRTPLAPAHRPRWRLGPDAPAARCLVWSSARCPFDMASLARAIVGHAPSQQRCAIGHFPSRKHNACHWRWTGGSWTWSVGQTGREARRSGPPVAIRYLSS